MWQQCATEKCTAGHCAEDILGDGGADSSVRDMPVAEMAVDLGTVELGIDALPDAPPDSLSPDLLSPDVLLLDTLSPDILPPDTLSPDLLSPDLLQPDLAKPIPGTWVLIPPKSGLPNSVTQMPVTFKMGSPVTEPCRNTNETQHDVTLTRRFEIMDSEVTQQMFLDLMGYNKSRFTSA